MEKDPVERGHEYLAGDGSQSADPIIASLIEEVEHLRRCLNGRDDFLGKINQWDAFVAQLPRNG